MSMGDQEQHKEHHKAPWLKPFRWQPGESGNLKGRPPGPTMKTWLQAYFKHLTDEERMEFMEKIDPESAWRMAEGNPQSATDVTSKGESIIIGAKELTEKIDQVMNEPEEEESIKGVS
jgi:hypothetical protein